MLWLILKLRTLSIFVICFVWVYSQTAAHLYKWVWGCVLWVCERGVKLKPLSLADGHSEDGLTQEQWGPLTKTTPPRHVASCHRGNPPWDRERADSWRGGLTKMESISFRWSSPALYLSPLPPVFLYSRPLWMWLTSHFTASCDWPHRLIAHPTPPDKKELKRRQQIKPLWALVAVSNKRALISLTNMAWAARFHTHCTLDFTPHFKMDEHFLHPHKEA